MPLTLQLVPPLFLLAGWLFFVGVLGKDLRNRRFWMIAGGLTFVVVIGLAAMGFQEVAQSP